MKTVSNFRLWFVGLFQTEDQKHWMKELNDPSNWVLAGDQFFTDKVKHIKTNNTTHVDEAIDAVRIRKEGVSTSVTFGVSGLSTRSKMCKAICKHLNIEYKREN